MNDVDWLAEYAEDGEVAFRIGRRRGGNELVAEWIGLVRLLVERDGTNPRFLPEPGAYEPDLEKIRRGSARLLLRHLHGELSLHGGAVADAGGAVVLLGRSGQGKSTLVAALCASGASLLSDDAVVVEPAPNGYAILPSETNHWLDSAALRALGHVPPGDWKAPLPSPRVAIDAAPLVALVELEFTSEVSEPCLVRVDGLDAMAALVPQVVRFVLDEPEVQRRELESLERFVHLVPVYRLRRPPGLVWLDAAAKVLTTLLHEEAKKDGRCQ